MVAETIRAFYSVEEFLERVPVGRTAFYAAVRRGEIRIAKIGTRTLVPVAEVDRLVNGRSASPTRYPVSVTAALETGAREDNGD